MPLKISREIVLSAQGLEDAGHRELLGSALIKESLRLPFRSLADTVILLEHGKTLLSVWPVTAATTQRGEYIQVARLTWQK